MTIHCTEIGDEGIEQLIAAPFFGQLETLDLSHGTIQDVGATLLAEQDLSNFKSIKLIENYISRNCAKELKKSIKQLDVKNQFTGGLPESDKHHLWAGSIE